MPNSIGRLFTVSSANTAERSLKATEMPSVNIALEAVTHLPERRWMAMDEKKIQQIVQYRMAVSLAREMVVRGLISEEEYGIMDTIFTNMFLETSCTIFGEIPG